MGGNGVADHVQHSDFTKGGGRCRQVHELGTQVLQQGLAVHTVQQHGRMGLRKGLGRRVHGDGHLDGVGEFGGLEDRLQGERFPVGAGNDGRRGDAEAMAHAGAGLDGDGHHLRAHGLTGLGEHQDKGSGNRLVGNAGHGDSSIVHIALVQEPRFHQAHLHRNRNHHLILYQRIIHGSVVRIGPHIEGGEFVGSLEAKVQRPVRRRTQMRLEGERAGKVGANGGVGIGLPLGLLAVGHHCIRLAVGQLFRGGIFELHIGSHGRSVHHHLTAGTHQDGTEAMLLPYHPTHRRNPDFRDTGVVHAHLRPVILRHGIQALVPGRHQHLCVGCGSKGKRVLRARIGFVVEARKLQRQRIAALFPPILPVIAHGCPAQEVEHLQAHGIRPSLPVSEGNVFQAAVDNNKLLILKQLLATSIHHHLGIGGALIGADTGAQRPAVRHRCRARNKHPADLRNQFGCLRQEAEHGKTLLSARLLSALALPFYARVYLIVSTAGQFHGETAPGLHLPGCQH